MENVKDKVVLITGATFGIGEATARCLAANGAKVVLSGRREDRLLQLVKELQDQAIYLKSDVTKVEDMLALVKLAKEKWGKIDVLFANAGIMPAGKMAEGDHKGWMNMIDINIKGVLNAMYAVIPEFYAQNSGHVIVTSSRAGTTLVPGNAVYCGTKHFVKVMLQSFNSETNQDGKQIRTTTIYPGAIKTELLNTVAENEHKKAVEGFYEQFGLEPEVIANAVLYAISQPDGVDVSDLVIRPTFEG